MDIIKFIIIIFFYALKKKKKISRIDKIKQISNNKTIIFNSNEKNIHTFNKAI